MNDLSEDFDGCRTCQRMLIRGWGTVGTNQLAEDLDLDDLLDRIQHRPSLAELDGCRLDFQDDGAQ
jgi:hypothetical protein